MKTGEWLVICLILGFLATLCLTEKCTRFQSKNLLSSASPPVQSTITVELSGAVKKPGVYHCVMGTSLGELLKEAGIKPSANRKKIPLKKILLSSQTIEIPHKKGKPLEGKKISLEEK